MRVLCAPDSFKGTLDAPAVAAAMAAGVGAAGHEAYTCPMADGGEGTGDLLVQALGGRRINAPTRDARGRPIQGCFWLLDNGTAVVESAVASGLPHLAATDRQPLTATSEGTGMLLKAGLDAGARELWLAIGGTATVDAGLGMLLALGAAVPGADTAITPLGFDTLEAIHLPEGLPPVSGLVDTMAPLTGVGGAVRLFAPQKGASADDLPALEAAVEHVADLLDPDARHRVTPGAGAGGGMGFALCVLGGTLQAGAQAVARAVGLHDAIAGADLVLTGEGCLDEQTGAGKAPATVARLAAEAGVPCAAVAGRIDGTAQLDAVSLVEAFGVETAMADTANAVTRATTQLLDQLSRSKC